MAQIHISGLLSVRNKYFKPTLFSFLLFLGVNIGHSQDFKIHSHNDYARNVPFWEAYANAAASIEADVILQNDVLYVAHEKATIQPERTLESLYLDPIRKAKDLKIGHQKPFILLIDIKTEAYTTLEKLLKELEPYENLWNSHDHEPFLSLVISGNRPKKEDYHKYPPHIKFDYQSVEDTTDLPLDKIKMVSLNFRHISSWNGREDIDAGEKTRLMEAIKIAHELNKPIRFWATPDTPFAWKTLKALGVDYINTDDPYGASRSLSGEEQETD